MRRTSVVLSVSLFGNGGNLAVATCNDISRLTNKLGICPGSGILASSLINEKGHDEWLRKWVEISARGLNSDVLEESLCIGISSSGISENVVRALNYSASIGCRAWLITAAPLKSEETINFNTCTLNLDEYHSAEVLTLLLTYQLTILRFNCPPISKASTSNNTLVLFHDHSCRSCHSTWRIKIIYKKNIILINEKPLLSYPINAAKSSATIDHTFVDTDCPDIALIAKQYGAKVIKRHITYLETQRIMEM